MVTLKGMPYAYRGQRPYASCVRGAVCGSIDRFAFLGESPHWALSTRHGQDRIARKRCALVGTYQKSDRELRLPREDEVSLRGQRQEADADELVARASTALKAARKALDEARSRQESQVPSSIPVFQSSLTFGAPLSEQRTVTEQSAPTSRARSSPSSASRDSWLSPPDDDPDDAPFRSSGGGGAVFGGPEIRPESRGSPMRWTPGEGGPPEAAPMPEMQLQRSERLQPAVLAYMEAEPGADLVMRSQAMEDALKAKSAVLPPLQSLLELTTAHIAPQRVGAEEETAFRDASVAGHLLQDGVGTLADGSTYERLSGEEVGANGYWCRWWVLRGTSQEGAVEWEEKWWEASDWSGMREMGAEKAGCNANGDAWREFWKEKVYYRSETGEPCVERDAHKWAHNNGGEEWEEKWGEFYGAGGHINKWADKWGKAGNEVWHEKWGEEYWGSNACEKWTDRWAEKSLPDGRQEQHGDKWKETFRDGKGSKVGENWYAGPDGHRYHRNWGENHWGEGWVQKYGNSTEGDHWDTTEQSGTYYNPIPHFTFQMALDHSPTLMRVPMRPKEATEDDLEAGGLSSF